MQTRDEPARTVRARLDQLGVLDDLHRLEGWQRAFVYDALDDARFKTRADRDGILAGARWLTELADARAKHSRGRNDPVVGVLRRAATALVHR